MRSNSLQLCLFSLLFAAAVQADISYELTHDGVPIGGAARTFTILVIVLLACAIGFAVETGWPSLLVIVALCAIAPGFFPSEWRASNDWVLYEILAPIALFFSIGFFFAPGIFNRVSLHARPR